MKTTFNFAPTSNIRLLEMPIGTLGIVNDLENYCYNGHIVLRTYSGLVSLTNPACTWEDSDYNTMRGGSLPTGTQITLKQE